MKSLIDRQKNDNVTIHQPIAQNIDMAFRLPVTAICLACANPKSISEQYPQLVFTGFLFIAATYLLLTWMVGHQHRESDDKNKITLYVGYLDSLLLGVILVLLPFSVITLGTVSLLAAIRAAGVGGASLLFAHISFLLSGMVLTYGIYHPVMTVNLTENVNFLALLLAPLFMVYVVWRLHGRQQMLSSALKEQNISVMQLKLNNYKLAKYLSPSLRKAIFSGKKVTLETQRKRLTIFFSDIKGFSELSEELEADTLTAMLNLYLTEMSDIALKFGGTVDKFIGDAIMVFFGDPVSRGAKEDCQACVSMAIAMQKRMNDLNKRWAAQGIRQPLHVRMGINTGFCAVGNFGTEMRLDYTLLGTEVNKASRLESAADAGEILISRQTYELIKDSIYCQARGNVMLKGFKEAVEIFAVIDLRANLGKEGQCLEHSTDGFSMFLDVDSIPHLQKQRVMASLEEAYEQLRSDIQFNTVDDVKIFK
jgi:adenylate cyclase